MPPRLPQSLGAAAARTSSCPFAAPSHTSSSLLLFTRRTPSSSSSSSQPSQQQQQHSFSSTPAPQSRKERRRMRDWLQKAGSRFKTATGEGPQYLGRSGNSQPFPLNPLFRSEPVLDEGARELVWSKIVERGESIKAVSAELGIDVRRVAAVVRLKEVEKTWIAKGKPLAKPYAKAVLGMLPTTTFREDDPEQRPHEPINEIHVHGLTMQQLFLPVPETRYFTRHDAAKAFHERMLSPDKRVPHPELIAMERRVLLEGQSPAASFAEFKAEAEKSERKVAERERRRAAEEEAATKKVEHGRFEFRFRDVNADVVGRDGKAPGAVGWRYGVPLNDRKKGQVKIPLSVE